MNGSTERWQDLLSSATQPDDERRVYELLAEFVASLARPPSSALDNVSAEASARLGYLLFCVRTMTSVHVHPAWTVLEDRAYAQSREKGRRLFRHDPGFNPFDGVARLWGFSAGLDSQRLKQIAQTGAC